MQEKEKKKKKEGVTERKNKEEREEDRKYENTAATESRGALAEGRVSDKARYQPRLS